MAKSLTLLVLLSLLTVTSAIFVFKFGKCPKPPIKQDFDITKYMGKWWEFKRFPAPFEFASTCGYANYTLLSSDKVKVVNAGIQKINLWFYKFRKNIEAIGEAVVVNASEPAKLRVKFGEMPVTDEKPNYFVVDTDYDNYAVVFSCSEYLGIGNIQFAWILTRAQGVAPAALEEINKMLSDADIDLRPFITVEQTDC